MKKRVLATLLLLAMVIGLCSLAVNAEEQGKYMVGFAKVDMDPRYTAEFRAFAQELYPVVNFTEELTFTINIGAEGDKTVTLRDGDPIPASLQGNSHTDVRLNTGNQDDNGDGIVDDNDGIFATAIAITAPGDELSETVILMSTDFICANATATAAVRKDLFEKYGITGDRVMIDGSHSHHAPGFSTTVDKDAYEVVYYLQAAWGRYLRTQLTQAAELAIADRAEATMSRGTIEAEEALCAQGEVGDYLNELRAENAKNDPAKYGDVEFVTELAKTAPANAQTIEGYDHLTWTEDGIKHVAVPELYEDVHYNGVRHDQSARVEAVRKNAWLKSGTYYAYSYPKTYNVDTGLPAEYAEYIPSSWDIENQKWLTAAEVEALGYAAPEVYATGNNFNSNFAIDGVGGRSLTTRYIRLDESVPEAERLTRAYIDSHLVDASEVNTESRPYIINENGEQEYVYVFQDIWVATQDHEMTEVDDTLLVLRFSFEESLDRDDILLVNWRAHTNKNRRSSVDWKKEYTVRGFYESFYQVSSDWINALRYGLEQAGYRVAYFSGASGNVNGIYTFDGWYIPEYTKTENGDGTYTYTAKEGTLLKAGDVGTTFTKLSGDSYTVTAEDVGKCKESIQGYAVIDDGYIVADASHLKNRGAIYGTELAQVALELLGGTNPNFQMVTIDDPTGGIRSQQIVYETEVKPVSLAEFLAAGMHRARDYEADGYGNNLSRSISFNVTYWELEAGNPETAIIDETYVCSMLDEDGYPAAKVDTHGQETGEVYSQEDILALYPDVTFDAEGKVSNCTKKTEQFAIAAYLHANSAISDYRRRNTATGTQVELNAIMLCDQIAILTAPGELYDRYSDTASWTEDGYSDTVPGKNLWESLHTTTYGEPFFLGYCNASTGYMPSKVTYEYNATSTTMAKGSYETQTTSYAQGTGEDVMVEFDWLLDQVNGEGVQLDTQTEYCQHCKTDAQWVSLTDYLEAYEGHTVGLSAGHYYVAEDTTVDQITVASTGVCLDLNGCTLQGNGDERVFRVSGILSVQDSKTGGKMMGQGYKHYTAGNPSGLNDKGETVAKNLRGPAGGTIYVEGTLNLHSGTLTQSADVTYTTENLTLGENERYKPGNGGVLNIVGTFNMYGGTVTGGNSGWAGGNIYADTASQMNLMGGSITGGKAYTADCVMTKNKVTLEGSASVTQLQLWPDPMSDAAAYAQMLTVRGTYTGTTVLDIKGGASLLTEGFDIGTAGENANLSLAKLTVRSTELIPVISGTDLILGTKDTHQCDACGEAKVWIPLSTYLENNETLASGHYYVDVDGYEMAEQSIASGVTVCLDLQGNDLKGTTRAFTVETGGVLNVQDSGEGGRIVGQGFSAANINGGTVYVQAGAAMNLHSGTLTLELREGANKPQNGGIAYVAGTMNISGGTLTGGQCSNAGGTIYTAEASELNLLGGSIENGTATVSATKCSRIRGNVTLSGSANVADLYLWKNTNATDSYALLTVKDAYTGTANLTFYGATAETLVNGTVIGNSDNANLTEADLTVAKTTLKPMVIGTKLVLGEPLNHVCEYCNSPQAWLPLSAYLAGNDALTTGHYYVNTDGYEMAAQTVEKDSVICLDLMGKNLLGSERAFLVNDGGILNIQDSGEGGTLTGQGFADTGSGGVINVAKGGILNLYDGTLTLAVREGANKPQNGGVVNVNGIFNMYAGNIYGGTATAGGNIYVYYYDYAGFNMYGGTVGTCGSSVGNVAARGKVRLEDDASITSLYIWPETSKTGTVAVGDILTVGGAYTGTTELTLRDVTVEAGLDIGNSDNADLSGANLTVKNSTLKPVVAADGNIVLAKYVAKVVQADGTLVENYDSVESAIANCQEPDVENGVKGERVVLLEDVANITVSKNVILDLNGKNITGTVTVDENVTLSGMDSATADYDIEDNVYGKIANVAGKGTVVGAEAALVKEKTETTKAQYSDVYLKVEEADGVSFHAIDLNLTHVNLRASSVGMYFTANFNGDRLVKEKVESFGVAMSIVGAPTAERMGDDVKYTRLSVGFGTENASTTSSILKDIMKTTQGSVTNRRNAKTQVYGRAYVRLADGTYVFGYCKSACLQQLVEAIDALVEAGKLTLDENQLAELLEMYNTYSSAMSKWTIPYLKEAANG